MPIKRLELVKLEYDRPVSPKLKIQATPAYNTLHPSSRLFVSAASGLSRASVPVLGEWYGGVASWACNKSGSCWTAGN